MRDQVVEIPDLWYHVLDQRHAKDETIAWLLWYNRSRLHSTLAYVSPMRFEQTGLRLRSSKPIRDSATGYGFQGQGQDPTLWMDCEDGMRVARPVDKKGPDPPLLEQGSRRQSVRACYSRAARNRIHETDPVTGNQPNRDSDEQ